jgi:flagellar basal-body rod protein FlgC
MISVFDALDLAGRALSAQRTRLDVASTNLANAQTTRSADGDVFRRRDVVLEDQAIGPRFGAEFDRALGDSLRSVNVAEIREDEAPPRMVHDPDHPDAGPDGYVAYPNINTVEEMVNMITTMRSYQANLNVLSGIREMAQRALSIGRGA